MKLSGAVLLLCNLLSTDCFIQNSSFLRPLPTLSAEISSTSLLARLWDRMEIEEDPEAMWYLLNCVAGLEIDLLNQCRQACDDMEDVKKFVVPTEVKTRSHGANRMVVDTKVKYQGYVFAKLRLCAQTYEAIQSLDLCRSWMGTVNQKGYKKLPPAPVALNEIEIENFGLEDLGYDDDEEEETVGDEIVIVDTEEEDQKAAAIEETVQTVYKGLRVEDMIKVTAKNKFFDEDGIVRRLKDGKVLIRFFTYGSMYEEWLDPSDVRKMSDVEILKGLGGPDKPITQREIDGPSNDDRSGYGESRGDPYGAMSGGGRNRRQDRNADRFRQGDSLQNQNRERKNWDWYKDNERRKRGGAFADGDVDMRGSGAQGNVDAQWGRGPQQRRSRDDRNGRQSRNSKAEGSNGDDWSSFVSSASSSPSKAETDDFFDSLMTDLSNDLESDKSSRDSTKSEGSDEDDFFASLMSEISDDDASSPPSKKKEQTSQVSDDDDFFASLEQEIRGGTDDKVESTLEKINAGDDLDDFFADLGAFDVTKDSSSPSTSETGDAHDFFADLEAELESELASVMPDTAKEESASIGDYEVATETRKPTKKSSSSSALAKSSSSLDPAALQKCTVPILKDMLRERGLKVGGKKAELIERLAS